MSGNPAVTADSPTCSPMRRNLNPEGRLRRFQHGKALPGGRLPVTFLEKRQLAAWAAHPAPGAWWGVGHAYEKVSICLF